MSFLKKNGLTLLFLLLSLGFIVFVILNKIHFSKWFRVFIIPSIFLFYIFRPGVKNLFFIFFLVLYSLGEFVFFFQTKLNYHIAFYFGNIFYITAYMSLIGYILSGMTIKVLFKRFPFHTTILLMFGSYLIYALDNMVQHHGKASMPLSEYVFANIYNLSLVLVLVFSFLSYLYHDTKNTFILFLVCFSIVFAELVQVAYFFMIREELLNSVYSVLLSGGFCLLYMFIFLRGDVLIDSHNVNSGLEKA